jgi:hypothetical protein
MIQFVLSDEELEWCKQLGFKRSASKNHADTLNSKNFMPKKPKWHRHYVGAIGELAYSKYCGDPVNTDIIGVGDDGTDFPGGVQVKASDTKKIPNLMFPKNQFYRKKAKVYVLVWVKIPSVYLVGKIDRQRIIQCHKLHDFGYGETMIVLHNQLKRLF